MNFGRRPSLSANTLTALVAAMLASVFNASFWQRVLAADLPDGAGGLGLLVALWLLLFAVTALMLSALAWRGVQKPALALVVLLSAAAAFFMDNYGAVVDRHALQSVLETDLREGSEWLSWRMAGTLLVWGVLPVAAILAVRVEYRRWPRELLARTGFVAAMALLATAAVLPFPRDLASLARNHGELRHLATPFNLANAVRGYRKHAGDGDTVTVAALGADAHGGSRYGVHKPILLVIVVGESARASSFSLNGYLRPTNPELTRIAPVSFPHVHSCGTNTATSVPCMFSDLGRKGYDEGAAHSRENLLDVLAHAGYAVEWEDNNTGSKGVATRYREEDMARLAAPGQCRAEGCYDDMLVRHLQAELAAAPADKVFVLHQLGSHGPAYYQRYPPAFERFRPSCHSNALQECSPEEIVNSYDNTILYTDHVLAALVGLLEQQSATRETALLYISDHGESTGEHGLYLHGAPYVMAPDDQTHVPMLLWTSKTFQRWRGLDPACVEAHRSREISHDHLFHSVLGLLDVQTASYRAELDALAGCAPA